MKDAFRGFYALSAEKVQQVWSEGLVVLDANVLLNLYRYTPSTANELLGILGEFQERLWLPYQAGAEYHVNRVKVIGEQIGAYSELEKLLTDLENGLAKGLQKYSRHPFVDVASVKTRVAELMVILRDELGAKKQAHPRLVEADEVMESVSRLYAGRVGPRYEKTELDQAFKEGKERYARRIPPGYMDTKKEGDAQFGDYVLWRQTLDKAKASNRPVLVVTDELKEDWWSESRGETLGPRPELVQEMHERAGVMMLMYRPHRFMELAEEHLRRSVQKEAIKEVEKVQAAVEAARLSSVENVLLWREQLDALATWQDVVRQNLVVPQTTLADLARLQRQAKLLVVPQSVLADLAKLRQQAEWLSVIRDAVVDLNEERKTSEGTDSTPESDRGSEEGEQGKGDEIGRDPPDGE